MVEEGRGLTPAPDRSPRTFRSPISGNYHFLRRPEFGQRAATNEVVLIDPEDIVTPEIEGLHRENQDVTGNTAIAIKNIMQTYVAYPFDTPDEVIKPQKDLNDRAATFAMIREFDKLPYRVYVHSEGAKDIGNGADIPLIDGVHGMGGLEENPLGEDEEVKYQAEVDPLELTGLSTKRPEGEKGDVKSEGVMSTSAVAEYGGISRIPDDVDYMHKLFAPMVPGLALDDPADITIAKVLRGLNIYPGQLRVTILNRPRNRDFINAAADMAVDLNLIEGGDLMPSVMASDEPGSDGKYDLVMGIGGAPEGLIAAAAAKATGRTFVEARYWPKDPEARKKYSKKLTLNDLIPARAGSIVVDFAHVTPDSKYTKAQGIRRRQNGHVSHLIDFTTVDLGGRRLITREF